MALFQALGEVRKGTEKRMGFGNIMAGEPPFKYLAQAKRNGSLASSTEIDDTITTYLLIPCTT